MAEIAPMPSGFVFLRQGFVILRQIVSVLRDTTSGDGPFAGDLYQAAREVPAFLMEGCPSGGPDAIRGAGQALC